MSAAAGALVSDDWLAVRLGKPAFRLNLPEDVAAGGIVLPPAPAFVYAKLPAERLAQLGVLLGAGFSLMETALLFEGPTPSGGNGAASRFAVAADEDGVVGVARNAFAVSRFHVDAEIPRSAADAIKADWVGNFFRGRRGTHMVVSENAQGICGFLQLVVRDGIMTVDLIGVDARCRGRGMARDMIVFATGAIAGCRTLRAGTQVTNRASVRLYQGLGMTLASASYTVHRHIS